MKKIFTLIATALVAMGASAQTLIDFPTSKAGTAISGTTTEGTFQEIACYTLKNGYSSDGAYNENSINLTVDGGFKAGDVVTIAGGIKNADESKRGTVVIFTLDGTSTTALKKFEDFPNFQNEGAAFTNQSYTLEADADKLYLGRDGNTGTNVTLIQVTRGGGGDEPGGGSAAGETESFISIKEKTLADEFAAIVNENYVATNVSNGNSIVKFGTTNVEVEAVASGEPADKAEGGQDITIGEQISAEEHTYKLVSINSTKDIKWEIGKQDDINFYYVKGTGVPAVSQVAEEIYNDSHEPTGTYRVKPDPFDPAIGGEPASGLYYKITTKVDGALKIGMFANKGGHATYIVDADTKQVSDFIVEGYINGQNDNDGKKKWLSNDEIKALHDAGTIHSSKATYPWVIGDGNQHFWGNVIVDAKANKTYYFFQGTTQPGFQGYTFVPGAKKEDLTGIEAISTKTNKVWNADAPMYNLSGQKVDKSYKGIVIQNGRKFVNK